MCESLESNLANFTNLKWGANGLLPCITQDVETKEVLMLAYMNENALRLSIETKIAHYFSRSKNRIWKKGETSGHVQEIKDIRLDCDNDSILLLVKQHGVACHTGEKSCFFKSIDSKGNKLENIDSKKMIEKSIKTYGVLDTLYHTILEKRHENIESSYTASLFNKGDNAIAKKIIEEAGELCFALKDKDSKEIVHECADLFYHVLVGLAKSDVHIDSVFKKLESRMGISGIAEKNSRA